MPKKYSTIVAGKHPKTRPVHRKRGKFPSERIVSLNLSKYVCRNLTNLINKLEISKKHLNKETSEVKIQETTRYSSSREKEISAKKIPGIARRQFKSLGRKFLKEFRHFSKLGERYSYNNDITYPQTVRWLKKAGLLDNHRITIRDVEVHFINKLKSGYELKVLEFIRFLRLLCEDRGLEMATVIFKLLKCRKKKKPIKKKKLARCPKNSNKKQEKQCAPDKKVSALKTPVKGSKVDTAIDSVKEHDSAIFKATAVFIPETEEFSLSPCSYFRKYDTREEKTSQDSLSNSMTILHLNKNKGWIDSNGNSDPFCNQPGFIEESPEENFTLVQKYKTTLQSEYSKRINDEDLENIATIENVLMPHSGKHPESMKETNEWIIPALKSIPPLENEVSGNEEEKLVISHSPKIIQSSGSQNSKISNIKETKLKTKRNRNNPSTKIKTDGIKSVKKQDPPRYTVIQLTGKTREAHTVEESYEYITSDDTEDNLEYTGKPMNKSCNSLQHFNPKYNNAKTNRGKTMENIKKVDMKVEVIKLRGKISGVEAPEIVSIEHFDTNINTEDDAKNNKLNFQNSNKVSKAPKRSSFPNPSKYSNTAKIKNCMKRIFNGDLTMKKKESIELDIENDELSSNPMISPKILSHFQEPNTNKLSQFKRKLAEKKAKEQKGDSSDNKCTLVENNSSKIMPSPKKKKKKTKSKRTFTNLPVKQVKKSLQKSRKEKCINKLLNNENLNPVSKIVESTNGRKIISSKKLAISTSCDKSDAVDGTRNESVNGAQISDIDADISKPESGISGMKEKRIPKLHKVRKGVRLRKKELKDPKTEIQSQESTDI